MTVMFIPGTPSNSNKRRQWARFATARERKKFRAATAAIAAEYYEPHGTFTGFVRITAKQISPVNRRRDPGGLAERLKPLLDGLVDSGILIDDDEDHIELRLAHSVTIPKHAPGIMLTLELIDDQDQEQDSDRIEQPRRG
jgi:hypothetical protein